MINKVMLRRLVHGEAYPPDTKESQRSAPKPARCLGCGTVHTPSQPLFEATPVMAEKFVTCQPCFQKGRSK